MIGKISEYIKVSMSNPRPQEAKNTLEQALESAGLRIEDNRSHVYFEMINQEYYQTSLLNMLKPNLMHALEELAKDPDALNGKNSFQVATDFRREVDERNKMFIREKNLEGSQEGYKLHAEIQVLLDLLQLLNAFNLGRNYESRSNSSSQ
jgi:hypothetical protein